MAARSISAAEKALQKIQDHVTCGICLEPYKQPKLLECFHVFCEQCLQPLAQSDGGQSLLCPTCRSSTQLHNGGLTQLQAAFHLSPLLDFQDIMKGTDFKDHCPLHEDREAEFYCETCSKLLCSRCLVPAHNNHKFDLVSDAFAKQERVFTESLEPVREQIGVLENTVESVKTQCMTIVEQKMEILGEIRSSFAAVRRALEKRETELVNEMENIAEEKIKTLMAQRECLELQLGKRKSFLEGVEESQQTCSQGEMLGMMNNILKQGSNITAKFAPESLVLSAVADVKFSHTLPSLILSCSEFGKVYVSVVCPEKSRVSGQGIKVAMRGRMTTVVVEAIDREGEACLRPIGNLVSKLVAGSLVRGTVKRSNQSISNISYQPQVVGKRQLHILINDHPISCSPFDVTVLPDLTKPSRIVENLSNPYGITVTEGGEIVVAEYSGGCVSTIRVTDGERLSHHRLSSSLASKPSGVAMGQYGGILIADSAKHQLVAYSSRGSFMKTVGTWGIGPLRFQNPTGITHHPLNHKFYIADRNNHRIQVLNSDLTYSSSFGRHGSNNGEFDQPYAVSTDSEGNVYVADRKNHRIQVFTSSGAYLRRFGREGKEQGELSLPVSIAIDSHNTVYIGEQGNNRVSVLSTNGGFLVSFGRHGSGPVEFVSPYGLAVDSKGTVYVSDWGNHRIQIYN